ILPATVGGLFWKRGTKEGALTGTIVGLVITILFTFFIIPPLGFSALVWALIVNTLLYIIVSLMTKAPAHLIDKYIVRVDSIINTGTEMNTAIDQSLSTINKRKGNKND